MVIARDLLASLMCVALACFSLRALAPAAALGDPGPVLACPVPVELEGEGVVCLDAGEAGRLHLRAGAGMPPDRLAAWGAPVEVNHATLAELGSLEGIGPKLAARIVAARPFRSVDDVGRVRGIGPRRLARLRARLALDH